MITRPTGRSLAAFSSSKTKIRRSDDGSCTGNAKSSFHDGASHVAVSVRCSLPSSSRMRYARFVRKVPPSTETKSWPTAGAPPTAARTPSGRFSLSMMLNGASGLVGGCHSPFAFFASTSSRRCLKLTSARLACFPGYQRSSSFCDMGNCAPRCMRRVRAEV